MNFLNLTIKYFSTKSKNKLGIDFRSLLKGLYKLLHPAPQIFFSLIGGNVMKNILVILFLFGFFWQSAQAIPAFSRKHDTQCTACHSAWPSLNDMGRSYKENGYRFNRNKIDTDMGWEKAPFVTTIIKARPFEKKDSGAKTLRALHEIEIMVAGEFAPDFSGFLEIEAEDDVGGGFAPEIPVASMGWHPMQAANVQFSWGGINLV